MSYYCELLLYFCTNMPHCYSPECNHSSVSHPCRFFCFPSAMKKASLRRSWIAACRRADREVKYYDRLCSCHFKNGIKVNGPTIFSWNKNKTHAIVESPLQIRKIRNWQVELESQTLTSLESKRNIVCNTSTDINNEALECMKSLTEVVRKRDSYTIFADFISDALRNANRPQYEVNQAKQRITQIMFNFLNGLYENKVHSLKPSSSQSNVSSSVGS